jgi:hypothetical protein
MAVFAASPTTSSAHPIATVPPSKPIVATSYNALPAWIIAGDPFVHVTNGVATIDPSASSKLDAATLANVQQAVSLFNSQPQAARLGTPYPGAGINVFGRPAPATLPSAGGALKAQPMVSSSCLNGSYISIQWWGIYIKFSECATGILEGGPAAIGAIIALIAALCAVSGPAGVVAAGFISVIAAALAAAGGTVWLVDTLFCNNRGVSVSRNWVGGISIGC